MPSTVFTSVSVPLASSTVMTPSFPTLSIAAEIILPTAGSLLAETEATCVISSLVAMFLDCFLRSAMTAATALSIPRLKSIGFAPAATFFMPCPYIACASTVAVVVPSPALSAVLEATSFTNCAPMFSTGSLSSISFATETPSLVMLGAPNFLSIITFLPLGPKVTFTASANLLTPIFILSRASLSKKISFAMIIYF